MTLGPSNTGNTYYAITKITDSVGPVITANETYLLKGDDTTSDISQFITITDDGSGVNTSKTTISQTDLSDEETGCYAVTVTAEDNAGNSSTTSITFTVYTDIVSDQTILSADSGLSGLYEDTYEEGRYIYRGSAPTKNYVSYGGKNWRIVAIEADGTYKLVNLDSGLTGVFDEASTRRTANSFCVTNTDCYNCGCSAWGTVAPDGATYSVAIPSKSTINNVLNGSDFYGTLTDTSQIVTSDVFNIGIVTYNEANSIDAVISDEQAVKDSGPVGLLNVSDYMRASLKSTCTSIYNAWNGVGNCNTDNWLGSSNAGGYWFISGMINQYNELYNYMVYAITSTASVPGLQYTVAAYDRDYHPVIYLKSDTKFTGSGTSTDPYLVNQSCEALRCNISTDTSDGGYKESQTLTINAFNADDATYSFDGEEFSSDNTLEDVTAAGTYVAYVKDSDGVIAQCAVELTSKTEYRSRSCTGSVTYGDWYTHSTSSGTSCAEYLLGQEEAEANGYTWYRTCDYASATATYLNPTTGVYESRSNYGIFCNGTSCTTSDCDSACNSLYNTYAAPTGTSDFSCSCTYTTKEYSRSCSCSSWGDYGEWSTTTISSSCGVQVETRTLYGEG